MLLRSLSIFSYIRFYLSIVVAAWLAYSGVVTGESSSVSAPALASPNVTSLTAASATQVSLLPQGVAYISAFSSRIALALEEPPCRPGNTVCSDRPAAGTSTSSGSPLISAVPSTSNTIAQIAASLTRQYALTLSTLADSTRSLAPSFASAVSSSWSTAPCTVTVTPTTTILSIQTPTQSYVTEPEIGGTYGSIKIRNHCNVPLYLWSVGARPLDGFPSGKTGYGTKEDNDRHLVTPNGDYIEPYRTTAPISINGTKGYSWTYDKLIGQSVSIKISNKDHPTPFGDILQFEYALFKKANTTSHILYYDVSLLDCADPNVDPALYGIALTRVGDAMVPSRSITDSNATSTEYQHKLDMCPGYQGGLKVTFPGDVTEAGKKCPCIECDGIAMCEQVYNYDRTKGNEPSNQCSAEYKGDVVVDLCAGNSAVAASAV
jgi:hypothetical protein